MVVVVVKSIEKTTEFTVVNLATCKTLKLLLTQYHKLHSIYKTTSHLQIVLFQLDKNTVQIK